MNWKPVVVACWIGVGLAGAPAAFGDETPQSGVSQKAPQPTVSATSSQPELSDTDKFLNNVKHPVEWFTWGADFRLRQEFFKDMHGFQNGIDDESNVLRFRPRIWADFGPFLSEPSLGIPNGLDFYIRLADETRYWITRPTNPPWNAEPPYRTNPSFNEIIVDNLYVNWDRPAGTPVSFRIGRQDLTYGRGFVILEGTPLDGSRSIYSDAAKMTLHADQIKTDLDLFAVSNKAYESRLQPIAIEAGQEEFTSEYDTKMLGAYLISKYFPNTELNLYYIYKDDSLDNSGAIHQLFYGQEANGRTVHTIGGLAQGAFSSNWDYYGEAAGQWGNEQAIAGFNTEENRQGYGLSTDLGYTFKQLPLTPRVHGAWMDLSGDDPHSKTFGGWDPVMSRWPQLSEIWAYRWEAEGKFVVQGPNEWSNLDAFTLGASAKPTQKMTTAFDYTLMLANEHMLAAPSPTTPVGVGYGHGYVRGSLFVAKLFYDFNSHVSGHLWVEYFIPGDFYAAHAADGVMLRWELAFKL